MLKIVTGYRGGDRLLDSSLAKLWTRCRSVDIAWSMRRVSEEDVGLMFRSRRFNPEEFALVLLGDRVVGFGWAWMLPRSNRVSLCVDPALPLWLAEDVVRAILGWAKQSFANRGARDVIKISAWYEHGFFHRLLKRVLEGGPMIETSWGTLMVFQGFISKPRLPEGYRARLGEIDDIPKIVEVVNRAFSVYDWFGSWEEEDIRSYYERYNPIVYVAEDHSGRIVGYVDAEIFEAVDGSRTGIIGTLAVDPQHQRKGVGRALLSIAIDELVSRGVDRVILDGVSGLEPLYRKLGFAEYRRWIVLMVPISALPPLSVPMERSQS